MATVPHETSTAFVTIGQVLESSPDIPPGRIRLVPTPGRATEEDVLAAHARDKALCELVDGMLVEKAVGILESVLAVYIAGELRAYLKAHKLGVVTGADGMIRLAAGLVRIPDVSFISWDQLPGRAVPREPILGVRPDLAIEVLSPSNTAAETERKAQDYFNAGSRLVWIVDPATRSARVLRSMEDSNVLSEDESLDGGEVLPGFSLSLRSIFDSSRDL